MPSRVPSPSLSEQFYCNDSASMSSISSRKHLYNNSMSSMSSRPSTSRSSTSDSRPSFSFPAPPSQPTSSTKGRGLRSKPSKSTLTKTLSPPQPTTRSRAASFGKRPHANPPVVPSHDEIAFPVGYEDAWGSRYESADGRTDLDRANIFITRFIAMSSNPWVNAELRDVITNRDLCRSVAHVAWAVMHRVFGNRHADFTATPLVQAMRFIIIKANIPADVNVCEKARQVVDFFFDPTLHRNLEPLPCEELVVYKYPVGRLRVCIVGGGPTGLASAISLAEKGGGKIEVHVWERRWVRDERTGEVGYPPTARRRDQVVTLQDSVTDLLTPKSFQALFAGRPERVWPGSANIQIRKVEDRFLKRCQDDELRHLIHLHPEGVTREELKNGKCGDFHVLLGTDGAASWVRRDYFRGYEKERGRSYALGLAFDRGSVGGLPWSQPLNMFLTLGQTRYLLNASDHDGKGYLNMQLTEDEWHKMVGVDGEPVHFGSPGCFRREDGSVPEGFTENRVFKPSEHRDSSLWKSIEDGLKLFGFKESEVINVVRIPIVVQAVREGVQQLPLEDSRFVRRPHALVAVAGDAAMTVHFWPGRGLNSGIKAGIAFAARPRARQAQHPILNQSGTPETLDWLLKQASSVPDNVAIDWLVGAMTQIADRLEQREDWYFKPEINVEAQIRIVLRQMHSLTLREMAVSFPWPTREMAGAEVLPCRSAKPEPSETSKKAEQKWLQQLWGIISKDPSAERKPRLPGSASGGSSGRFEAPRFTVPGLRSKSSSPKLRNGGFMDEKQSPPMPMGHPLMARQQQQGMRSGSSSRAGSPSASLRRSNAGKRVGSISSLPVPLEFGGGEMGGRQRSCSVNPGAQGQEAGSSGGLTRLMSVKRQPNQTMLCEAMALALFGVGE
ncbi:unnamed protein product [Sordaria macrospora k-hell]|uniref:WGS project CABT00000000 data, contig 2.38 n=1 Tax=Sordaria macrospora (strain ATCC MYA-333 / DSM 997 / K(L3346) / K-hell) TaxID=771870 RepID=F7W7E3_SORMK|nr:uncharacterized protein SMAC_06931 [Sordaria macrospora k-hell]CCC13434.1 unnamed protein product [Sordaria macrospora k-hell]